MFDGFTRKLSDLAKRAEALDGQHSVPSSELFTDEFLLRNTDFSNLTSFFEASDYKIDRIEDLEAIPSAEWDGYVRARTRFASWNDMCSAAGTDWMKCKLGFDAL